MNQSTALCRRAFLVGLTTQILVPISRDSAQGSTTPTEPGRAPFGLTWGMSVESVRSLYSSNCDVLHMPCSPKPEVHFDLGSQVTLRRSSGLPQNVPSGTSEVGLWFGSRNRLYFVYALGEPGQADAVMERYKKFSSLLSDFYGPGTETVAAQSWFSGAARDSTLRETSFSTNEVGVLLSLISGGQGEPWWSISYVNFAGSAEVEADKAKSETDGL